MSDNSVSLHGKVVAITGAARGIGLATAQHLARAGARVAVGDVDAAEAEAAGEKLGPQSFGTALDVRDAESFATFLDAAEERLGPLDVLINNAGIMPVGPLLDETEDAARAMYEVNVLGVLTGIKLAVPRMLASLETESDPHKGSDSVSKPSMARIVNVASYAGVLPVPGQVSYAGTKAAVIAITEGARWEFKDRGVGFTTVIPSFTNTELIAGTGSIKSSDPIEPREVAEAIVEALRQESDEVYVPKSVKTVGKVIGALPRRARFKVHHSLGTDRAFIDLDAEKRRTYSDRISR